MARIIVPDIGTVAERWTRRAQGAAQDYQRGVETTQKDWAGAATAAKGSWQAGVSAAAGRDGFAKGVQKAGTSKWRANTVAKGPARFSQGVQVAQPEYQGGFAPFLAAIGAVDLPPRGPRGAPGNYARVQPIGTALNALKLRG